MDPIKISSDLIGEREQNLGTKAYEVLLKMLINRELPVNTVLQERKLAELLNISRTPVRDALNRLENEGFITRAGGRTPVVKEFSIRELIETLHVRRTLESEAASLSAGRVPPAELDAIEAGIRKLLAEQNPSPQDDWEIDSRLHNALAQYSGNQLLTQYIESLRLKTRMFNLRQVPERFVSGHHEHLEIIAALRSGDADAARVAAAKHIDNVRESIVRRLSQL